MTVPPAGTRILFRGRLPHAFPELPIYIQTSTTSTTPQPVYDRVDCDLRKSTFDYARSPWLADHPLLTRRRRSLISYLPLTLLNWKIERTGLWTDWTQSQGAGGYLIIPSLLFLFFSFLFLLILFHFIGFFIGFLFLIANLVHYHTLFNLMSYLHVFVYAVYPIHHLRNLQTSVMEIV